MQSDGYKIRNKEAVYFITFAVVEWVDVFTRKEYRDIVIDSLKHCQEPTGARMWRCLLRWLLVLFIKFM